MLPLLVVVAAVGLSVVSTQAAPVPSEFSTLINRGGSGLSSRGISSIPPNWLQLGPPSEEQTQPVGEAAHPSPPWPTGDFPLDSLGRKHPAVVNPSESSWSRLPLQQRLSFLGGKGGKGVKLFDVSTTPHPHYPPYEKMEYSKRFGLLSGDTIGPSQGAKLPDVSITPLPPTWLMRGMPWDKRFEFLSGVGSKAGGGSKGISNPSTTSHINGPDGKSMTRVDFPLKSWVESKGPAGAKLPDISTTRLPPDSFTGVGWEKRSAFLSALGSKAGGGSKGGSNPSPTFINVSQKKSEQESNDGSDASSSTNSRNKRTRFS